MKIRNTMVVASLALATGCIESSSREYGPERPLPPPMASADRAGVQVKIYELTPGNLAVVATGDLSEELEGKSPVEIYEAVAAAPAPSALVETEARIAEARRLHPSDHEGVANEVVAPARAHDTSLSDSDFQATWCNFSGADFDLCFLNRTGTSVHTYYNIHWIHGHVNAYRGSVTQAVWHRSGLGSWKLTGLDSTTGTSYVSTFNEQDNGDYEISVTDAAGDGYHHSLHGDF